MGAAFLQSLMSEGTLKRTMPTSEPVTPHPGIGVWTHPVAGSQASVVQALLSLQTIGVNTHPLAALQVSVVHALLSLQTIAVLIQAPVVGLQISMVQASLSLQRVAASEHGPGHCPVAGSQTPVVQTTGVNTHPVAG